MDLLINDRHTCTFQKTQKKLFANLDYDWPILQYQDIAKNLTKSELHKTPKIGLIFINMSLTIPT